MFKAFIIFLVLKVVRTSPAPVNTGSCQPTPIQMEQCRHQGYQYTSVREQMTSEAGLYVQNEMKEIHGLANGRCSIELNFLLCSLFLPMCDPLTKTILEPCGHVCDRVQTVCESSLKGRWPKRINCSIILNQSIQKSQCISSPTFIKSTTINTYKPLMKVKLLEGISMNRGRVPNGECRHLRHSEKYVFINRTGRCALKCFENDLFSKDSKRLAETFMLVMAATTFLSTLFTCITCCLSDRIKYPEQPIVFLTLSFNLYSLSFLLRLFFSRSTVSCDFDPVSGEHILIQEGLENTHCAITFLLNFFFSTATHFWWVTLNASWVLYSVFKVSIMNLKANAGYFHLFVWLSTSMLTVSVLVLRCVEADELLGICSVGGQSPDLFFTFSIVPKSTCLILGALLFGVALVFQRRRHKSLNANPPKFLVGVTPMVLRLTVFSVGYTIMVATVIACDLYQYINYNSWKWVPRTFSHVKEPIVIVFLLSIFSNQVIGINSAIWIVSLDVATTWKKVFEALRIRSGIKSNQSEIPIGSTNQIKGTAHTSLPYLYSSPDEAT